LTSDAGDRATGPLNNRGAVQPQITNFTLPEKTMWTKPEFTEMRFGFEVTMYIYNR
jgi:pyrroloquinoline quinone biosynthesis protein A